MRKIRFLLRRIKFWFQRRIRGYDDSLAWNINYEFILWLKKALILYLKQAPRIVDIEYHKFEFEGKTKTQKEMIIDLLCECIYLEKHYYDHTEEEDKHIQRMLKIFKELYYYLWW